MPVVFYVLWFADCFWTHFMCIWRGDKHILLLNTVLVASPYCRWLVNMHDPCNTFSDFVSSVVTCCVPVCHMAVCPLSDALDSTPIIVRWFQTACLVLWYVWLHVLYQDIWLDVPDCDMTDSMSLTVTVLSAVLCCNVICVLHCGTSDYMSFVVTCL